MNKREEFEVKRERLRALMASEKLDALVLSREANCAWLSCGPDDGADLADVKGGRSRVWTETEGGVATLIVTRDAVHLYAENIEFPRLVRDEFTALPFAAIEDPWQTASLARAVSRFGEGAAVGCDMPAFGALPGARLLDAEIAALRASLTPRELERYRWLGARASEAAGAVCRALSPGWRESDVHAALLGALGSRGIDNPVPIVTSDARMWVDRHGLYTDARITRYAMVVLCARKWGLTACLTRLVHFGPLPAVLVDKHAAARRIARRALDATRPGATLGAVFYEIVRAYASEGHPGEPALHHQGGSTGYAGRDVRATAASVERVQPEQAFAWNPSIAGVKVEDTFVAREDDRELLTGDDVWPRDADSGQAMILVR